MIPSLYPDLDRDDLIAFMNIGKDPGEDFEKGLKSAFNSKYAMTFSSGRAGLFNILKANDIKNKTVLVTAYTCSVVTEAIVQSGNIPVFIDTEECSFNAKITADFIRDNTNNLGAIVVTNLYGFKDFSDIGSLKRDEGVLLILDDALSPGHVPERRQGTYDYVTISCGVRKPFSCLGGGVVFTDDEMRFKTLKDYILKNRKSSSPGAKFFKFVLSSMFFLAFRPFIYEFTSFIRRRTPLLKSFFDERNHELHKECPGYDEDMMLFQKRIGINQLKKFKNLLRLRSEIGNAYYRFLVPYFPWVANYWKEGIPYSHVPFLHDDRDNLEKFLLKNNIDTERYFDYVIPYLPRYNSNGRFLNAEYIAKRIINLPVNTGLNEKIILKIAGKIREFDAYAK